MPVFKAMIEVTVLIEADNSLAVMGLLGGFSLTQLDEFIDLGDGVGDTHVVSINAVPFYHVRRELLALGNDGEFFQLEEQDPPRLTERMELHHSYRTLGGDKVTVTGLHEANKGYETVTCAGRGGEVDPIHRYNRTNDYADLGRVTGSPHDFTDPRNIVAPWTED